MQFQENISLKAYNTFGIDVIAKKFCAFNNTTELHEAINNSYGNQLIIGGGSNILFTRDFDGTVLQNRIKGIQLVAQDNETVTIKAGAGENWHRFVLHCIENNWGGIENLSLIPGCVGASPMQNIGAYGVEIKDVFHSLTAFHIQEQTNYTFNAHDCQFGYRESIFKRKYKDQFVITAVNFTLQKKPVLHIEYGAIRQELEKMGVQNPAIKDVSNAVIHIRQSKLPNPAEIGNAGSFFKNPSIPADQYQQLQSQYEHIVGYANADGSVKLAAGWLIEACGWKGFTRGDAGVHDKQALVLVNRGQANGLEIYQLSEEIIASVQQKFNVTLEREVNIL
jgi:UDP-N-acetylmuramate dehydrogenase